jgi:Tfp pilus assembly protein PilX
MTAAYTKQKGAVLLVSMILLLMLTIMAITVASNSSLQQRMSANAQDQNLAFQAAETGWARWVMWFEDTANAPTFANIAGASGIATVGVPVTNGIEANCLQDSKFTCHHMTITATAANATAVHSMGYLVRDMSATE